jgi:IS30 family transposase
MAYVEDRVRQRWSPEQIAGRLAAHPPADLEGFSISPTTIYRSIWSDPERAREFRPFLRIAAKPRRKPYGKPSRQGQILGKRSIEERPPEADERTELGHWEGDTMIGKGRRGVVLTCVDRASRYTIARKVEACATAPVTDQLQQTIRRLPDEKRQSLTLDNGREFAARSNWKRSSTCRSTSPIRTMPGNAAPTKTPMACCASTCPKAPT